jgi:PAS domain S-box-containing protein
VEQPEPFGLLLDQSQDKIALIDEDGTFTYVNAAAKRMLGFEPDELIGRNAFEFIHPDDIEEVRRGFEQTIQRDTATEVTTEYRYRTKAGGWVWLESRMSVLTDDKLDGYVISSRDVTDRVEAEHERADTASRLEQIAAVSGDVLWMFDADWSELLFVNAAYEEVYGSPIEELRADPAAFLETIHPDDIQPVKAAMQRLSAGESMEMEYRVNATEGDNHWVWVQAEPIVVDGEVVRITGFTRDITDRQRREQQLIVMDNLLRHNLRNDLNVILGQADFIDDDLPEAAEHTRIIRRVGDQLLRTAEKEREVIELITKQQGCTAVNLHEIVEASVGAVHERYPNSEIEIAVLEPTVVSGREELEAAVEELLENAIQHSDATRPQMTVTLEHVGDHAELTVEDEHTPIPTIEADVLTGDHNTSNVYHSSGLGFWLVYWAVELSNGYITVNSGADRGNRITVSLSLLDDA